MKDNNSSSKRQKGLSNDMLDGIAAVIMIAIVVSAVTYWLHHI